MADTSGQGKKPGFLDSVKSFLNGKPRDPSAPLTSTKTYFRILILLIIVAVVLAGIVFVVSMNAYNAEQYPSSYSTPVPTVTTTPAPTPVRTAVPTAVPTQTSSTVSKQSTSESVADSKYSAYISFPPAGAYFVAASDDTYVPSVSVWKQAAALTLPKSPWKYNEVHISVKPASVRQTAANGGWNTITIEYPWRISWEITGDDDSSEPYANAEFVLCKIDGTVVDKFGWKGFYTSQKSQTTGEYQPGEYVLAVYQRGCGISLEFEHAAGPVTFENSKVR